MARYPPCISKKSPEIVYFMDFRSGSTHRFSSHKETRSFCFSSYIAQPNYSIFLTFQFQKPRGGLMVLWGLKTNEFPKTMQTSNFLKTRNQVIEIQCETSHFRIFILSSPNFIQVDEKWLKGIDESVYSTCSENEKFPKNTLKIMIK